MRRAWTFSKSTFSNRFLAVTRSRGRTSTRSWSSVSTQVTGATAAPRQRCSSPGAIAESRRAAAPSSSSSTAATCRGSDVEVSEVSEDAEDDSEDSDDRGSRE